MLLVFDRCQPAHADEAAQNLPYDEAVQKDLAQWRELLDKGDFDALEKIADELRTNKSKYRNGRGRQWRFAWCALAYKYQAMTGEDYARSFASLDAWLKARPQSINARLVLVKTWEKFAFTTQGGATAAGTPVAQPATSEERIAKASSYLDEIDTLTKSVDNVYRRMRIDLTGRLGEKPDLKLVYDGLQVDPANMELVHGMAISLLPRWFGEEGELEKFADEVALRTKDSCGDLHYTTATIAAKEYLKGYLLDTHPFDWPRLQRGFRDLERLYPHSREHLDDEAQLAFMAEDLEAVYATMAKIGDQPHLESWKNTEIFWKEFQPRFTREMLQGDQKRTLLGHTRPVLALDVIQDGEIAIGVDWDTGIRLYEVATGKHRSWIFMQGIRVDSISIHPKTGLMATGLEEEPGVMMYNFANGQSGQLPQSPAKVRETAFSLQGDLLATADETGLVAVFDLKTGQPIHQFKPDNPREVTGLVFHEEADKLAVSTGSGGLQILDLNTKAMESDRKVSPDPLRSIAWAGKHLAVGTSTGQVHVLDSQTGQETALWKGEPLEVASLAFSEDGEMLAIGLSASNWDTKIAAPLHIWKYQAEKTPQPLVGHKQGVNCVRFAHDGKTLLSASHDWTIRVWDVP